MPGHYPVILRKSLLTLKHNTIQCIIQNTPVKHKNRKILHIYTVAVANVPYFYGPFYNVGFTQNVPRTHFPGVKWVYVLNEWKASMD